jgi:hypothetical protein
MSLKRSRTAALVAALAAVVALSAAASASALTIEPEFKNWTVEGALTIHKLNDTINLPEGSTFSGVGVLNIEATGITGTITGETVVPPFTASIPVLGLPLKAGLTFTEVGKVNGSVTSTLPSNCPEPVAGTPETCVTLSVPFKATMGITSIGIESIKIPTMCATKEPVSFPLSTNLTLLEIVAVGSHFKGDTTLPNIKCSGLFGGLLGPVLSLLMSGPENGYVFYIHPPV